MELDKGAYEVIDVLICLVCPLSEVLDNIQLDLSIKKHTLTDVQAL